MCDAVELTLQPTDALEINDILCFGNAISGRNEPPTEVSRVQVTATGQGVTLPSDAINVLRFTTSVRAPTTKTFFVKNTKKIEWTTTPRLSLECPQNVSYFSCQPEGPITILPNQKAALQLTYLPLTMTDEAGRQAHTTAKGTRGAFPAEHTATLFCALPEGEACCIRYFKTTVALTTASLLVL